MDDPRSVKNPESLNSYRAWQKQALLRSGYQWVLMAKSLLIPFAIFGWRFAIPCLSRPFSFGLVWGIII